MKVAARVWGLALGFAVVSLGPLPTVRAEDERPAAKKRVRAKPDAARRAKRKSRARAEARPPAAPESAEKVEKTRETEVSTGGAPSSAAEAARTAASGVNAEIVKEGDTNVKVMSFTGLGIEGRLKSPQLVYFVQRVRAEFDRPILPHRSFMPELARTTQREPVR